MRPTTTKVSSVLNYSQPITYIWGQCITTQDITVKQPARVAPVRPVFSSPLASDEENEGKSFTIILHIHGELTT